MVGRLRRRSTREPTEAGNGCIARRRQEQRRSKAPSGIGNHTRRKRHHGTAENRNIDDARPIGCAGTQFFAGKAENEIRELVKVLHARRAELTNT